jgi:hypothetical protein
MAMALTRVRVGRSWDRRRDYYRVQKGFRKGSEKAQKRFKVQNRFRLHEAFCSRVLRTS